MHWNLIQTTLLLLILVLIILRHRADSKVSHPLPAEKKQDEDKVENMEEPPPSDHCPLIEPIVLELGFNLVKLVENRNEQNIIDSIQRLRRQYQKTFGFLFPKLHVRDNLANTNQYKIYIRGVKVGEGKLQLDKHLAIVAKDNLPRIQGEKTQEPSFGIDAYWIDSATKERVRKVGYTVVSPLTVLSTHIGEVLQNHLPVLLDYNTMQAYLEETETHHPLMIQTCVTDLTKLLAVLRNLLRERVPICDQQTIIETFGSNAHRQADEITEMVRQKLRGYIAQTFRSDDGIHALAFSDELQKTIETEIEKHGKLSPQLQRKMVVATSMRVMQCGDPNIVVLCTPELRKHCKTITELISPPVPFLSDIEIPPTVPIVNKGLIKLPPPQEDKNRNDIPTNET